MRALIDRHHADLFYSLQLLFEDRLGIRVYTPAGMDWWTEGYWNFGRWAWGDDRLAQQFLNVPATDSHHPDRPIRSVTLDLAKGERWDYVVATVQDNQQGFARFASEVGARYVLQVGNTRSEVDWSLDPLAIVSSEVPIEGRGVRYHQMLPPEFTYRPPTDARSVRSFVNCFPQTQCYAPLERIRPLLDGPVYVHGIDGPDGNIERTRDIADLMAQSGWGWHDKEQGDGFGHVLHDWAAIGRPLIGHGSHYAGLMGEVFWEDGITCLDLDKRSLRDVADTVNTISRAEHELMCREMRRRFDRIDYDAEVEQIRELLA